MKVYLQKYPGLRRAFYFFPIQLFLMTLKKNFYYIIIWIIFFGFITRTIGTKYGVPYLFLYPEYLNKVNFLSYLILGFSCGGLIMAYNISSYIINSFRFPFLATLERPFYIYFLNNFIIPVAFVLTYIISVFYFRSYNHDPFSLILLHLSGFVTGIIAFMFITMCYFYLFDREAFSIVGIAPPKASRIKYGTIKERHGTNALWYTDPDMPLSYSDRSWFVETYCTGDLHIRLSRGSKHYDNKMLEHIFKHTHQTGAVFEIIALLSLLLMGLFRENPLFMVPAGASIMLLFTIFIMLISALHTWARGWTGMVVILLFFILNYFSHTDWSYFSSKAYGLNYSTTPASYSYESFKKVSGDKATVKADRDTIENILEKWRARNMIPDAANDTNPDLVIINTSGGGLRSTLWSFYTLQYLDSISHGQLFRHTELITGSSGGIIGAAYYRELYLEKQQGKNIDLDSRTYFNDIGQDILNPVAFTIATNDLAIRFQRFNDGKYTYTKDRAYAFEEKLNMNTGDVLRKRLGDYKKPEQDADIPMMFITPSIVNDGRTMLISPLGLSFMTAYNVDTNISYQPVQQSVEFSKLFKAQDASRLFFTSALRMSATFPFITPPTQLPSNPTIELMDAGLIDNFGLESTTKFIYTYRNWLPTHVRRIIIIQVRDQSKQTPIRNNSPTNIFNSITFPVSQMYNCLFPIENFNEDRTVEYMSRWYKGNINIIYFQLNNDPKDDISLSWRLTDHEKALVLNSMKTTNNKDAINQLKALMNLK